MYFLSWIIVGSIVGWSAGKILKGDAYGPPMDISLGVCGAVIGGLLMQSARLSGYRGPILTTFVAVVCAALLTFVAGFVNGRRIYARQL
jgi:uncharacterized membrane protein YeaQ/YmgE (transglycosylase-associated protein family)